MEQYEEKTFTSTNPDTRIQINEHADTRIQTNEHAYMHVRRHAHTHIYKYELARTHDTTTLIYCTRLYRFVTMQRCVAPRILVWIYLYMWQHTCCPACIKLYHMSRKLHPEIVLVKANAKQEVKKIAMIMVKNMVWRKIFCGHTSVRRAQCWARSYRGRKRKCGAVCSHFIYHCQCQSFHNCWSQKTPNPAIPFLNAVRKSQNLTPQHLWNSSKPSGIRPFTLQVFSKTVWGCNCHFSWLLISTHDQTTVISV